MRGLAGIAMRAAALAQGRGQAKETEERVREAEKAAKITINMADGTIDAKGMTPEMMTNTDQVIQAQTVAPMNAVNTKLAFEEGREAAIGDRLRRLANEEREAQERYAKDAGFHLPEKLEDVEEMDEFGEWYGAARNRGTSRVGSLAHAVAAKLGIGSNEDRLDAANDDRAAQRRMAVIASGAPGAIEDAEATVTASQKQAAAERARQIAEFKGSMTGEEPEAFESRLLAMALSPTQAGGLRALNRAKWEERETRRAKAEADAEAARARTEESRARSRQIDAKLASGSGRLKPSESWSNKLLLDPPRDTDPEARAIELESRYERFAGRASEMASEIGELEAQQAAIERALAADTDYSPSDRKGLVEKLQAVRSKIAALERGRKVHQRQADEFGVHLGLPAEGDKLEPERPTTSGEPDLASVSTDELLKRLQG